MQDGQETGVATVNHGIEHLFADEQHLVRPLETQHGLGWATRDGGEGGRL